MFEGMVFPLFIQSASFKKFEYIDIINSNFALVTTEINICSVRKM
jgi:hypothetical protein